MEPYKPIEKICKSWRLGLMRLMLPTSPPLQNVCRLLYRHRLARAKRTGMRGRGICGRSLISLNVMMFIDDLCGGMESRSE